jgi:hypothetical protein
MDGCREASNSRNGQVFRGFHSFHSGESVLGFKKSTEFIKIYRNSVVAGFLNIGTVYVKICTVYLNSMKKSESVRFDFFQPAEFLNIESIFP